MTRFEHAVARVRAANPLVVDSVVAAAFTALGLVTVFFQDIRDDAGSLIEGYSEPGAFAVLTVLATCTPIAARRRAPLAALVVSTAAIFVHLLASWPEGMLPFAVLFLTYTLGAWCALRQAIGGLATVLVTIAVLTVADAPKFDTAGAFGILGQFSAAWAVGVAMHSRRAAADARVRQADERAEAERQSAARVLAEERLRIAQELHDVVAHSMSVIAVQAGVGAHVIDDRPEQARVALETISATSRRALTEMRRLLGVLRDDDGARSYAPAPGLADLPRLVDEVRAAAVPVTLRVEGEPAELPGGVDLSAYRVVQEALTNVIKHAGATTRVDVCVRHEPGAVTVDVVDDGRGLAARFELAPGERRLDGTGQGLVGMRERVELWGGELFVGAAPGGGYRVHARLPYGDAS
jgi:signal transduction histidine kinase